MLKVKNVTVGTEAYGGAYESVVTFQVGDKSYNTVAVKLLPEAVREVVELVVAKATAMLVVQHSDLKIAGEFVPLPLIEEAPPAEFAEVDDEVPEAPPAAAEPVVVEDDHPF